MDTKISTPYQTIHDNLSSGKFEIAIGSGKPYITTNGGNKVVVVRYESILTPTAHLKNISDAQSTYGEYLAYQSLHDRKATPAPAFSTHHLRAQATAQAKPFMEHHSQPVFQHAYPRGSHEQPYRPQTTPNTELTKAHMEWLHNKFISGDYYFNDDVQAITPIYGSGCYKPNPNGEFSYSADQQPLAIYSSVKKQYDIWLSQASLRNTPSPSAKDTTHANSRPQRAEAVLSHLPAGTNQAQSIRVRSRNTLAQLKEETPYPGGSNTLMGARKKQVNETIEVEKPKATQPPGSIVNRVQQEIRGFLDNIDTEINQIKMPSRYTGQQQEILRNTLKSRFNLYRIQFNEMKRSNTTQSLQKDFNQLKEMQRSMYFAVSSPQAKPMDLPLKGIRNRGYDCLPISQNQCEIHNQSYLFFVTAYQLTGEAALKFPDESTVTFTADNKISAEYQSLEKEISSLEQQITALKEQNAKKEKIIEEFKKIGLKTSIPQKEAQIKNNKAIMKSCESALTEQRERLKQKKPELEEELQSNELQKAKKIQEMRSEIIEKANKWSEFYTHQLSRENQNTRTLPEQFKDTIDRGNDFPTHIFNVPEFLSARYNYIVKKDIQTILSQPWTAIYADQNGAHFLVYIKRQDGSISEINDSLITEKKFNNIEKLIEFYSTSGCKYSLRHKVN